MSDSREGLIPESDSKIGAISQSYAFDFWIDHFEDGNKIDDPTAFACQGGFARSSFGYRTFKQEGFIVAKSTKNSPTTSRPEGALSLVELGVALHGAKMEDDLLKLPDFDKGVKKLVIFYSKELADPGQFRRFVFQPLDNLADRENKPLNLEIEFVEGREGISHLAYRLAREVSDKSEIVKRLQEELIEEKERIRKANE